MEGHGEQDDQVQEEEKEEEREEGRGNKNQPQHSKRQRTSEMGDGWEKVSPLKWKASPLKAGGRTFFALNTKGMEHLWLEKVTDPQGSLEPEGKKVESPRVKLKAASEKMTPVQVQIKRLEQLNKRKENKLKLITAESPSNQRSILSYLTKEGGGKGRQKVLGQDSRQPSMP